MVAENDSAVSSRIFACRERPIIIAHRGGSLEAPENTLEALEHGVRCGSDWQEIDVGLSRDNHPVVLHDETLERTTSGRGPAAQLALAELEALQAHRPVPAEDTAAMLRELGVVYPESFAASFAHAKVPSLRRALGVAGARLMIELKVSADPAALVSAVVALVYECSMAGRVALGSFSRAALIEAKRLAPDIPRIGIFEDMAELRPLEELGVGAFAVRSDLVAQVRAACPANIALWTWTVYSTTQARACRRAGADGLITDIPEGLIAASDTLQNF